MPPVSHHETCGASGGFIHDKEDFYGADYFRTSHTYLYAMFPLVSEYEDPACQTFMDALVMPLYNGEVFGCNR
jgi:hypothetical protein